MNDTLSKLQNWYLSQCNGEWEHGDAIVIETLDNPGWMIKIDLRGTSWEQALWNDLKFDRGSNDWVMCSKKETKFEGYGDPGKLQFILDHFLSQIAAK